MTEKGACGHKSCWNRYTCKAAANRAYCERHPERVRELTRERSRRYRERHPERARAWEQTIKGQTSRYLSVIRYRQRQRGGE